MTRKPKRSAAPEPIDWHEWRSGLMDSIEYLDEHRLTIRFSFEQLALRSAMEHRCADCGAPGTVEQTPTRYCHVSYWFCDDCDAYWKEKAA